MPKFVIERELPGAGSLTADEVHTVAAKSNEVLSEMAPRAQWVTSYVTSDKVYCVYIAENEARSATYGPRRRARQQRQQGHLDPRSHDWRVMGMTSGISSGRSEAGMSGEANARSSVRRAPDRRCARGGG